VNEAVKLIGKTPTLEFRLIRPGADKIKPEELATKTIDDLFFPAELTGRFVKSAKVDFDPTTYEPKVALVFNDEGAKLFAKITRENVGKTLAIFLDNEIISNPSILQEITGGNAEISGRFKLDQAKALVRDLNYGALPLPIELVSTQTIGATLGTGALNASLNAGLMAFIAVSIFLLAWYRIPGLVAVIALAIYTVLNLAVFKFIPVTLTSAGIAGFILSLGMAVDANILIFERMKEELKRGRELPEAIKEGFGRAWLSIRDSNLSSIITAVILYMFASTAVIKGFALVFGLGVIISMFSALTASRTILLALGVAGHGKVSKFLFGSGIK
jgi:protein-export membrane protein SecD